MSYHAAVLLFIVLGPVAALAPRGMPVWLLTLAAVAAWGLARERRRPAFFGRSPADRTTMIAAIAFILWASVSALWSPSPRAALTALEIAYVGGAVFLIWAWLVGLAVDMRRRLAVTAAVSVIIGMAVYGFENALEFPIYRWWHGERALDWLNASNVPKRSAVLLALLLWPTAAYAAVNAARNRRPPWEAAFIAGGVAAATLLTSRSALFGMLAGAVVYVPALLGRAAAMRRLLQLGIVVAFVGAAPLGLVLSRATADLPTDGYFRSALHRMEIWGHAATRIRERPLTGQGVDASRNLPIRGEASRFEPLLNSALPLHPHNAFLQIWLELGAVGAALAGFLLWRGLRRAATPAALGYAGGALALAASAYGIWQAWWMCGIAVAGLLTALATSLPSPSASTEEDRR